MKRKLGDIVQEEAGTAKEEKERSKKNTKKIFLRAYVVWRRQKSNPPS